MIGAVKVKKICVGVFMSERSSEREVSFNSGRTVCDHLDVERYEIVPLFENAAGMLYILPWHFLYRGKIDDFIDRLADEAQLVSWDEVKKLVDSIAIAAYGSFAEDGRLQGLLDVLGMSLRPPGMDFLPSLEELYFPPGRCS